MTQYLPQRVRHSLLAVGTVALFTVAACGDSVTSSSDGVAETLLAEAMLSTPVGFSATESSFAGVESDSWRPMMRRHVGRGGPFGSAFGVGFMGGGLGQDFADGTGFRAGNARGPFGGGMPNGACSFNASSNRHECVTETDRLGLTVDRWVIYADLDGNVQRAPDSTTFSRASHAEVQGTVTVRDSATRTVRHVSDRLITGLQKGSTQRTVDGTSSGVETVNGVVAAGAFSAERIVADTTRGVIVPVTDAGRSYPIAGTVIRSMQVSVSVADGETETASWREVLTYDGSNTATLVITRNGVTKTCSVPLPMGRPVCE